MNQAEEFLHKHPDLEYVELLSADINGILRGKRLPAAQLHKLFDGNVMLPRGTVLLDTLGHASENVPYGYQDGDPDAVLRPISHTLVPVSWQDRPAAQILVEITDTDNMSWFANPTAVLQRCLDAFKSLKFQPVVAIEMEFHLLAWQGGQLIPASAPNGQPGFNGPQTYNLENLADYSVLLSDIEAACCEQGIALAGTLTEYGEGQFEINLQHSKDVLTACHHAVMLKRIVRQVALKHKFTATFMAKPLADNAGNGMHIHISVLDEQGENRFAPARDGSSHHMQYAIAGLVQSLPGSMAVLAPNANSYRRFVAGNFAPMVADWGVDHRGVAIRVPRANRENARLEHRVAGADANPYLVVASVLAGVLHGLECRTTALQPTIGNAVAAHVPRLPLRWSTALAEFAAESTLHKYFGSEFCALYHQVKLDEEEHHHQQHPESDCQNYLRVV